MVHTTKYQSSVLKTFHLLSVIIFLCSHIFVVAQEHITSVSAFEKYQQLKDSELINKGWVPSFIPRSSYDIHEKHKVDVARINVKFRFRPGDTKEIEASCSKVSSGNSTIQHYRCKHGTDIVIVKLDTSGEGEILSE